MGWFGNLARTIGSTGNDVSTAQQNNTALSTQAAADKLKQVMAGLQIQDLKQKIAQNAQPGVDKDALLAELNSKANDQSLTPNQRRGYSGLASDVSMNVPLDTVLQNKIRLDQQAPEKPEAPEDISKQYSNALATGNTKEAARLEPLVKQFLTTIKPPKEPVSSEYDQRITNYLAGRNIPDTPANRDKADAALKMRDKEKSSENGTKTPFELWKMNNPKGTYDDWLHDSAKPKVIPPDVLNLIKSSVPDKPTPGDSQRLAQAADKVFGGSAHRQDLLTRGRQSILMGLRAPYQSQAYSKQEYQDILNSIKSAAGDTSVGGPTILPPTAPPPGRTGTISTQ